MKKIISVFMMAAVMISISGCRFSKKYTADQLNGTWVPESGDSNIVVLIRDEVVDVFNEGDHTLKRWSGRLTPPEGEFDECELQVEYDYDRTVTNTNWRESERSEEDDTRSGFEFYDGKLIYRVQKYTGAEMFVLVKSESEHPEIEAMAERYDSCIEAYSDMLPLTTGDVLVFDEVEPDYYDQGFNSRLYAFTITNPNPYGIYCSDIDVYYTDGATKVTNRLDNDTDYTYIAAGETIVYVNELRIDADPSLLKCEVNYNPYSIDIEGTVTLREIESYTILGEEKVDGVFIDLEDVEGESPCDIAVAFYKNGEIVGVGRDYNRYPGNDNHAQIMWLSEVTEYDSYELFIY